MEIKFRGKGTGNKEWVYGSSIFISKNNPIRPGIEFHQIVKNEGNVFDIDEETLGLFTGKKDKYGEEIYKDDIVKIYDKSAIWVGVVHWSESKLAWMVRTKDYDICSLAYCKNFEKVSTIHDNPELMEIKK